MRMYPASPGTELLKGTESALDPIYRQRSAVRGGRSSQSAGSTEITHLLLQTRRDANCT